MPLKTFKIYIKNMDRFIEASEGTLLSDAIKSSGLHIDMPCNGLGICGKCALNIRQFTSRYNYSEVLACYHVVTKDIEIEFLSDSKDKAND